MKYFLSLFFIAVLFLNELNAQQPLPFYERNQKGEYYLLRTDSMFSPKVFGEICVLTKNGIQGLGKMTNLYIQQEEECCTNPDPFFLMGNFKAAFQPDTPYYLISEKVDEGKLFDLKFSEIKNSEKFSGDAFQKPLLGDPEENYWRFRWKEQIGGKTYLEKIDEITYNNQPSDTMVFHVSLNACEYLKQDSFEILYCHTDSAYEDYLYEPAWVVVYLNNKLLDARMDYFNMPVDGYGPFQSLKQNLVGWYKKKTDFFLIYYPGYVVTQQNGMWVEGMREPCRYYGECDCAEEE